MENISVLLLAHGSGIKTWNDRILSLLEEIRSDIKLSELKIGYIDAAFLNSRPYLCDVIENYRNKGFSEAFVIPLFITQSKHIINDIPVLLNLDYKPLERNHFIKNKNFPLSDDFKSILGPTLDYVIKDFDIIPAIIKERIEEASRNPQKEELLLIAHGSQGCNSEWEQLLQRCCNQLKKKFTVNCAYIEAGQNLASDIYPYVEKAASKNKKLIVQGVYLVNNAKDIYERFLKYAKQAPSEINDKLKFMHQEGQTLFTNSSILPHRLVNEWLIAIMESYSKRKNHKPKLTAGKT